jgi:integrase
MNKARGTVIRRGDRYTVVLDLGRDENGKRIRRWHAGYVDREEAEKARTELLGSLDQQTYVAPSKVTVRQFIEDKWLPSLDELVAAGGLKASTVASYRRLASAYVLPKLGRIVLKDLSKDHLRQLYGHLRTAGRRRSRTPAGLGETTVHAVHITIHRMLKDAQEDGLVARNVADLARKFAPSPKKCDMQERVWSPSQLGAFLESVRDDRLLALWTLLTTTGLRRGEVAGLTWSDLDLDARQLTISRARVVVDHKVLDATPKTGASGRTIGLDATTVRVLRSHWAKQAAERLAWGPDHAATDLVFTWENGAPLHPDLITRTFKRLAKSAGLPVIVVHGLRHSYASAALEAGVAMKLVSDRLGHSSMAVTADVYSHVRREVDQQAADQVAALIFKGSA